MTKNEKKPITEQGPILPAEDIGLRHLRDWRKKIDQLQVTREDVLMDALITTVIKSTIPEFEAAFKRAMTIRAEYVKACNELAALMNKLKAECVKVSIEYQMSGKGNSGV